MRHILLWLNRYLQQHSANYMGSIGSVYPRAWISCGLPSQLIKYSNLPLLSRPSISRSQRMQSTAHNLSSSLASATVEVMDMSSSALASFSFTKSDGKSLCDRGAILLGHRKTLTISTVRKDNVEGFQVVPERRLQEAVSSGKRGSNGTATATTLAKRGLEGLSRIKVPNTCAGRSRLNLGCFYHQRTRPSPVRTCSARLARYIQRFGQSTSTNFSAIGQLLYHRNPKISSPVCSTTTNVESKKGAPVGPECWDCRCFLFADFFAKWLSRVGY